MRVDRVRIVYAGAVPTLDFGPGRVHERIQLVLQTVIVEVEGDVVGEWGEWVVGDGSATHIWIQPVPDQVVVLVYGAVPVIVEVTVVVQLAVNAGNLDYSVRDRVVAYTVVVGVDLMAGVREAVVVVIDVVHVHQTVVVVVGVGRVRRAVVVVVGIDEVRDPVAVEVAVDDHVEGLVSWVPEGLTLHVVDPADEM